jgi:hypothetical protein
MPLHKPLLPSAQQLTSMLMLLLLLLLRFSSPAVEPTPNVGTLEMPHHHPLMPPAQQLTGMPMLLLLLLPPSRLQSSLLLMSAP